MFPEIDYDFDAEEVIEEEITESIKIGRTPLYEFDRQEYVIRDGKVVECTQEEAARQWLGFFIKTKLGKYRVYDDTEFGSNVESYIGYKFDNSGFVASEIERELEEGAEMCRAIDSIEDFEYEMSNGVLHITFAIVLATGDVMKEEIDV